MRMLTGRTSGIEEAVCTGVLAVLLFCACADRAEAQTPAEFYKANCISCHTIGGGRLVGPDLKGVTERKDPDWLARFVLNPQAMINSGDPYAVQLLDEYRGVVMPAVPGMTRARAEGLLELIKAESALEKSQFAGLQISDRPFTAADVLTGRRLFLGQQSFKEDGPACVSCHTVHRLGGLSGGRLGPDLTKVYERIGSRLALAAWLQGPATTTMRPIYMKHPLDSEEILSLVAFFEKTAQQPDVDSPVPPLNFFLIGLLGSAFSLALFDGLWRKRFRAVRRPLVKDN